MIENKKEFKFISKKNPKSLLPNALTIFGVCLGLSSIKFAIDLNYSMAVIAIGFAAILDTLDGRVARLIKGTSKVGKELDSLTDVISFGVAPGFLFIHFIFYLDNDIIFRHSMQNSNFFLPASLAFLIPIFSAYRLANFNIDNKQKHSFIGLPTPALAIFIASIPHIDFNKFPMFTDIKLLIIIAIIMKPAPGWLGPGWPRWFFPSWT